MTESSTGKPSRPEDWTLWLESAAMTPFGPALADNYDGVLRDFWQRQFDGGPAKILDIGCGNGALCWIADELLNRPSVTAEVVGIDFADLDPFRVLHRERGTHPGISFRGNTLAEAL